MRVAAELGRTLDFAKIPKREKAEVLAAFAAPTRTRSRQAISRAANEAEGVLRFQARRFCLSKLSGMVS